MLSDNSDQETIQQQPNKKIPTDTIFPFLKVKKDLFWSIIARKYLASFSLLMPSQVGTVGIYIGTNSAGTVLQDSNNVVLRTSV